MARTLQTLLDEQAVALVGRERERAALLTLTTHDIPLVAIVHGIAGVGKSALLRAAAVDARARGAAVVTLDGGAFEPTERGFLAALGGALRTPLPAIADAAEALAGLGTRVVVMIDTFERLPLLDAWLRKSLLPALPVNARLALAGRAVPVAWERELGDLMCAIRLENLHEEAALALLRRAGLDGAAAEPVAELAQGHPLSLQLAAATLAERPGLAAEDAVLRPMVDELAGLYLEGLEPATRRAVDAASVVRCTTLTLLDAMLPDDDPADLFERLRALPFVEVGPEGLLLHDTVRAATGALLRAADPQRYRAHRGDAWRCLRAEVRTAGRADLWRYTADMLYLLENPIVRHAFFPARGDEYVIEPATAGDRDAVLAISARHAVRESTALVDAWWQAVPEAFRVVRDGAGVVQAFSCLAELRDVPRALVERDPIASALREHLRRDPLAPGQRAPMNRFALAAASGEVPSGATATIWLDTKRAYLEMRPQLRRMYLPALDAEGTLAALGPLGFARVPGDPIAVGDSSYTLLCNDFGPGSVDGWLGDVVGRELQAQEPRVLDAEQRRLALDGRLVDLSRLELDLLRHLQSREGRAVTREELLREVWGHEWTGGGSNVVEVVVSGLRKKLGDRAGALETVRGVGYRLGPLD